jgi:serine/threonine protein kinase
LLIANKVVDEDADTHYYILKILGRGGFGEVYHVRSKLSLEEYAVCNYESETTQPFATLQLIMWRKRVHRRKAFSKDREAIKIFENELTNLKRLSHHHLVKFVGYVNQ